MKRNIFGGLDAARFLRAHWQKKPLVVRNALPEYAKCLSRSAIFDLASREEIESRIVARTKTRWTVRHGPFARSEMKRLPRSDWTLLVQGVDQVVASAARLLREFSFIPYARLDDVMVSYAAPGGGVGPHFDSYDVFLVQGSGNRRWGVSAPRDFELDPAAPLKVLRQFEADDEWLLEPGDMLYLPPGWAHDGIAVGECITYSIGFRAPAAQELAGRFLDFLHDGLKLDGLYEDPDLKPTKTPGRIDEAMAKRLAASIGRLRWSAGDVERFIGCYLSEPKPNVVFARPRRPMTVEVFARAAEKRGIALALATRMLYRGRWIFLNGEAFAPGRGVDTLRRLADTRVLAPGQTPAAVRRFLYDAYRAGYIRLAA